MSTVTIENVPSSIVKTFWEKINYNRVNLSLLPKKRKHLTVNWFTHEVEKKIMKDGGKTYWPFSNVDDFLSHLKSNDDN